MSQAPVYGGDEINAIVVDPGSFYTRIGFAGEDSPKVVLPTCVGRRVNPDYDPEELPSEEGDNTKNQKYQWFFDDDMLLPRKGTEVVNPMQDGIVTDWEAMTALWDYGLRECLRIDMSEHPFLITEQAWNTDANRQKAMEIAFEHYNVPAFYIVKTPVCALLTSNKPGSGLVVDMGHDVATVTPVIDGLVLFKPSRRSRLSGRFLSSQIDKVLKRESITVTPRYLVSNKKAVTPGQAAEFTPKTFDFEVSESFDKMQREMVYHEFKEEVCRTHESGLAEDFQPSEDQSKLFEFPDGYNQTFGRERYETTEALFKPRDYTVDDYKAEDDPEPESETRDPLLVTDRTTTGFKYEGITKLISDTINACDVDVRPNLANNVVITGGTSLTYGFNSRINEDLTNEMAGMKVRLYAPGNTIERKNAAWVGGSILASLGTFHQLWISKKEYGEVGAEKLLEKRFR